ncbi:hypothetical protein [Streptacidiphilus rugosus]|uniref:hypothetical protein n=1 Tax=Streptacidiphilus rugosus TaxID=405783 RepID=UPI00068931AF|nr:hypothetical protein [Streptacidiphilus rugosus]
MDTDREGTAGPRTLVFRAGTAAAVLLLAAACSSSATTTSAGPSPAAPTTQAATAPAAGSPAASAVSCSSTAAPTVSGSGPADTAGAASKIATNYAQFFDPATPAATKIGLLQNGAAFAPVMQMFGKDPQAAQTTVGVTAVNFTGATTADVTFDVCLTGTVALPGSKGKSVLESGTWKVGDATLCSLLQLKAGATKIPGCS